MADTFVHLRSGAGSRLGEPNTIYSFINPLPGRLFFPFGSGVALAELHLRVYRGITPEKVIDD